ncbi:MAG TPA: glycosyltransferase [Candidatus Moranbacteria bacterium]|nr:glycosyltransferase [Candidatus Moranbacteria bacterium]
MSINLNDVLTDSAEKALLEQKEDGSMLSGYNGPYFHPETPIRNTSHWLVSFLKAYNITGEEKYLKASERCINYLVENKPEFNYCQRTFKGKDKCNGLIGPAWVMEAFLIASKEINRRDLSDLASDIFCLHEFDEKLGLWHRREIDGEILSIDWTFNHQLWFAAIGSMFDKKLYPKIHNQIKIFIEKLPVNFGIYKSGLIWHPVSKIPLKIESFERFLELFKNLIINKEKNINKAIGYHQFNLYAFAILKENYPNLSFWQSKKFQKALKFIESEEYEKGLINNKFGFDYNVAGIEMAHTLKVFKKNSEELQKYWLKKQFQRNYDFEKKMLCKNTDDPETLSARIYEATRLDSIVLNIITEKPFVSVIVPVYNDLERIKVCIECLLNQSYPKDKYEIIIIDNNSSDSTPEIIKKYPVKLLFEKEIQSSYAARNRGIRESKGEIIIFTDSDCQPAENWIENGIATLYSEKADLIAGKVSFIFSDKNDIFEICDSLEHMQQEYSVKFGGSAATANLFSKRNIFNEIGFFPDNVKSGGDGIWTYNASAKGFKLIYCQNAEVFHPTRKKDDILKKKLRIGYGSISASINKKRSLLGIIFILIRDFIPPIRIKLDKINTKKTASLLLKIYLVKWLCSLYFNFGKLLYIKDTIFQKIKR